MNLDAWLKSGVGYGWDLIRSALEGARSGGDEIQEEESPGSVLLRSARTSLALSVAAASVGLLAGYWVSRRKSARKAGAFGLAGAAIGFAGGMAWGTRHMTGEMARGAIRKMDAARDAHWLARHPIDYA